MNERPIYHLDLFSGIGGFALAAQWCGIQTIAFVEKDEAASRILAHHFPGIRNLKDVTKLCLRCYDCEQYESDDSGEIVWCHRCEAEFGDCECIGTDA